MSNAQLELVDDATDTTRMLDPDATAPTEPVDRAQWRLKRLTASFSLTLVTITEMYRDEDWRYLRRDDGSPYENLAQVIQDATSVSMAMARRYVQGAELLLPLSEMTVEGTVIEITSHDVASLGKPGAETVIERSKERLDGVDDPQEAAEVVKDTIAETRAERDQERRESREEASHGEDVSAAQSEWDSDADWDQGPTGTFGKVEVGGQPDEPTGSDVHLADPIRQLLAGASTFDTPEARKDLHGEMKALVSAIVQIGYMDPRKVADELDFDSRGILLHVEDAMNTLARLRSAAVAQPWFIARMAETDASEG